MVAVPIGVQVVADRRPVTTRGLEAVVLAVLPVLNRHHHPEMIGVLAVVRGFVGASVTAEFRGHRVAVGGAADDGWFRVLGLGRHVAVVARSRVAPASQGDPRRFVLEAEDEDLSLLCVVHESGIGANVAASVVLDRPDVLPAVLGRHAHGGEGRRGQPVAGDVRPEDFRMPGLDLIEKLVRPEHLVDERVGYLSVLSDARVLLVGGRTAADIEGHPTEQLGGLEG